MSAKCLSFRYLKWRSNVVILSPVIFMNFSHFWWSFFTIFHIVCRNMKMLHQNTNTSYFNRENIYPPPPDKSHVTKCSFPLKTVSTLSSQECSFFVRELAYIVQSRTLSSSLVRGHLIRPSVTSVNMFLPRDVSMNNKSFHGVCMFYALSLLFGHDYLLRMFNTSCVFVP